jgi:tryptophan 2,3-dioxygenase
MSRPQRPLSYSEYINDRAIVEALRIPREPPLGRDHSNWPLWHPAGEAGMPGSQEWQPGLRWPTGRSWSHHEVLFIRTHQAFEVWFALALHEIDAVLCKVRDRLAVAGKKIEKISLDTRDAVSGEFSPRRFPLLERTAKSFAHDFIQNRVLLLPSPGRYDAQDAAITLDDPMLQELGLSIDRATKAIEVSIPFFDVLASLSPRQFLEFRDRLAPASGFGSTQFREIEMVLGLRELCRPRICPYKGTPELDGKALPEPLLAPSDDTPVHEAQVAFVRHHEQAAWDRLATRYREPSLRDLVYGLLNADPFARPSPEEADRALDEFASLNVEKLLQPLDRASVINEIQVGDFIEGLGEVLVQKETIVAAMLAMNHADAKIMALHGFLERCLRLDGALLRWRDHHIRFVEGMIGRRPGTGGAGVNYLRSTTDPALAGFMTHAFPALWQARTICQIP